jgi:hypothetical protein
MLAENIKVVFVPHMFDRAGSYHQRHMKTALSLPAARGDDGATPFRLSEGEPFPTSYGEDTHRKIFGSPVTTPAASPSWGSTRARSSGSTVC